MISKVPHSILQTQYKQFGSTFSLVPVLQNIYPSVDKELHLTKGKRDSLEHFHNNALIKKLNKEIASEFHSLFHFILRKAPYYNKSNYIAHFNSNLFESEYNLELASIMSRYNSSISNSLFKKSYLEVFSLLTLFPNIRSLENFTTLIYTACSAPTLYGPLTLHKQESKEQIQLVGEELSFLVLIFIPIISVEFINQVGTLSLKQIEELISLLPHTQKIERFKDIKPELKIIKENKKNYENSSLYLHDHIHKIENKFNNAYNNNEKLQFRLPAVTDVFLKEFKRELFLSLCDNKTSSFK